MTTNLILSIQYKSWVKLAFIFFIIAGILGSILRFAFVGDLPDWIDYRNITHAHSHVAMMGWVYSGLYLFIISLFNLQRKIFSYLFWLTMVAVFGMLISFSIYGYGLLSIFFSSMHIILSYIFCYLIFKELKIKENNELNFSILFLKTGLLFLVCSSFGTLVFSSLMIIGLKGSILYYTSVQFFLHFQFNGWFIFTTIAIFLKISAHYDFRISRKLLETFYWLLTISCVLTYALALTWSTPDKFIFWTNSAGVLLQLGAIYFFYKIILQSKVKLIENLKLWTYRLWYISMFCFVFKILIQGLVAIPYLATVSYTIKNFVIGFIHLLMLGAISTFLLGLFYEMNQNLKKYYVNGLVIFLVGFFLSELLLFLQGFMLWQKMGFLPNYYLILFTISVLMPIGITVSSISLFAKDNLIK